MEQRPLLNVTFVSSILGIISFFIFMITLPEKSLHLLSGFILFPFSEKIIPGADSHKLLHWLAIVVSIGFYIIFSLGLVKLLYKKENKSYPKIICQDEIAAMLDAVESSTDFHINEKIIHFMNEFDKTTAQMFGMDRKDLKSLWVLQMGQREYEQYFGKSKVGRYDNENKTYLCIVDLNDESHPTEEEKRIIQWALRQPNPQFWDDRIKRNFRGVHKEFVFVRNYGEFRLGYALLFNQYGKVTEERLKQFHIASSYLMLLGKIDNLTEKMVKYIVEKVV
ncbi:hypothetical protein [Salirhabdus salicampi]|uniref:hypothetical protein n=1 Tax=Salirhabdus salicampi TaxID=476102 RepID=UPI0020C286D2|nr:hypothetical protein [Salirhabdus salicampi]MCP8615844.1 hypothetical protein [Salirhabdus salicampi]